MLYFLGGKKKILPRQAPKPPAPSDCGTAPPPTARPAHCVLLAGGREASLWLSRGQAHKSTAERGASSSPGRKHFAHNGSAKSSEAPLSPLLSWFDNLLVLPKSKMAILIKRGKLNFLNNLKNYFYIKQQNHFPLCRKRNPNVK